MKLPRNLSGESVIRILTRSYGWEIYRRKGSHVTLKKASVKEILTVPLHGELKYTFKLIQDILIFL